MQNTHRSKAIEYIQYSIRIHESEITRLRADLGFLQKSPPEIPTWSAMVASSWNSEGEPDWSGTIEAATVRDAVYEAMLAFCKKAGRVYPGKKDSTGKVYDHFDVQGTIYLLMELPNGTPIPVEQVSIEKLKKRFNSRAPKPKLKPRPKSTGLT